MTTKMQGSMWSRESKILCIENLLEFCICRFCVDWYDRLIELLQIIPSYLYPLDSCLHVLTCSSSGCLNEMSNCNGLWDSHAIIAWPSLLYPELMKFNFKWLEGNAAVPGSGVLLAWAVLITQLWDIIAFHCFLQFETHPNRGFSFTDYFTKQLKQVGSLW